jgi:hypothetical protein
MMGKPVLQATARERNALYEFKGLKELEQLEKHLSVRKKLEGLKEARMKYSLGNIVYSGLLQFIPFTQMSTIHTCR